MEAWALKELIYQSNLLDIISINPMIPKSETFLFLRWIAVWLRRYECSIHLNNAKKRDMEINLYDIHTFYFLYQVRLLNISNGYMYVCRHVLYLVFRCGLSNLKYTTFTRLLHHFLYNFTYPTIPCKVHANNDFSKYSGIIQFSSS